MKRLFSLLTLLLLTVACNNQTEPLPTATTQPTEIAIEPNTPTPEPTDEPSPTAPPPTSTATTPPSTPIPTDTPIPTSTTPPTPVDDGSRLLVVNSNGLFSVHGNGTNFTQLVSAHIPHHNAAVSPDQQYIAYISADAPVKFDDQITGLTLYLYDRLNETTIPLTPLTSATTEPQEECDSFYACPVVGALIYWDNLAWSPDGSQLAFIGAMDGEASDLYIYTVADASITRLSTGNIPAIRPQWSPDGQTLIYEAVRTPGRMSTPHDGYQLNSVWAYNFTLADHYKLYDEFHSQKEMIVTWLDNERFGVYSTAEIGFPCPAYNLRIVNATTGEVTPLWDGFIGPDPLISFPAQYYAEVDNLTNGFFASATYSPSQDLWLLNGNTLSEWCGNQPLGLYFWQPEQDKPALVNSASVFYGHELLWSEDWQAFSYPVDGEWHLLTPAGETITDHTPITSIPLSVPLDAQPSPAGNQWAWANLSGNEDTRGLWVQVGDNDPIHLSNSNGIYNVSWNPAGDTLFYLETRNEKRLFTASAPDFTPIPVNETPFSDFWWDITTIWLK